MLLLITVGSQAQTTDIKWHGDSRYSRSVKVEPGKPYEFCGDIRSPLKLTWSFESSQPLTFRTYQPVTSDKPSAELPGPAWKHAGTTDASMPGRYCWSWTNTTDKAIELAFDVMQQPR